MLTTYRATDRRVYNGAYCSDMEREKRHTESLMTRLKRTSPSAACTYFPVEGKYMVFNNVKQVTGNFHESKQLAIIEAIETLEPKS
jgi:hypothetical protein